ncbi:hypothetical protein BV22DRAFT_1048351 [Leucogyrophana mollusca]|uniref:Uncharacterized protein n=1 Tax=Leucogyrophana mollusca TaxID=85980 RepID=A0ACB8BEB2_9AGAM|nr:hypothetical protein BV22DRAFT_1048351 [Leucogyrophana mollusca]
MKSSLTVNDKKLNLVRFKLPPGSEIGGRPPDQTNRRPSNQIDQRPTCQTNRQPAFQTSRGPSNQPTKGHNKTSRRASRGRRGGIREDQDRRAGSPKITRSRPATISPFGNKLCTSSAWVMLDGWMDAGDVTCRTRGDFISLEHTRGDSIGFHGTRTPREARCDVMHYAVHERTPGKNGIRGSAGYESALGRTGSGYAPGRNGRRRTGGHGGGLGTYEKSVVGLGRSTKAR